MFVKEIKVLAPTEEAYEKFRQDLKSLFYEWVRITGSKSAEAGDDDNDLARTSRDDLVSDFFKSILHLFGPRVRTVSPDMLELQKLLGDGIRVLYPDLTGDFLSLGIYKVAGEMIELYLKSVSPDRRLSAKYQTGRAPMVYIMMDHDDGDCLKPLTNLPDNPLKIKNRKPFPPPSQGTSNN